MKNKGQILTDVNRVFDTPFEVQEKTVTQDENGIQKEQWTKKYKLFADGKNLYGKEYEIAKQTNEQKTVKFIIKAGVKLDTSMRIVFQKAVYDIDNVDNIGFKNELIEVKAIERSLQHNGN